MGPELPDLVARIVFCYALTVKSLRVPDSSPGASSRSRCRTSRQSKRCTPASFHMALKPGSSPFFTPHEAEEEETRSEVSESGRRFVSLARRTGR